MLSHEENELLTRVGRGTPMGEMLRCYWMPVPILLQNLRTTGLTTRYWNTPKSGNEIQLQNESWN